MKRRVNTPHGVIPRGPVVVVGMVAYGLVSVSMPLGNLLKPALGEAADVVMMPGVLWPYPLFLSLQSVLPVEGTGAFLAFGFVVALGLIVVWSFTNHVQARLGHDRWANPRAYVWAPWIWFVPLAVVQVAVYGMAVLAGLPVGE